MPTTTTPARRPRAFTLIELMVSIAIIALLIAVLLPALGGARRASMEVKALANARTTAAAFATYTTDNAETYPFGELRQDPLLPAPVPVLAFRWYPEGNFIATTDAFSMAWAWPAWLATVTPWATAYETWVSPGRPTELPTTEDAIVDNDDGGGGPGGESRGPDDVISWRYSNSFIASPRLWAEAPPADAQAADKLRTPVRTADVRFTSGKVLLWDTHLAWLPREPTLREGHWDAKTPMAFADGHADSRVPLDARPGRRNIINGEDRRLHNTPDGVLGSDY